MGTQFTFPALERNLWLRILGLDHGPSSSRSFSDEWDGDTTIEAWFAAGRGSSWHTIIKRDGEVNYAGVAVSVL